MSIFYRQKSLKYYLLKKSWMRQRSWLELVKDYDCSINYHLGKVNVVLDALNRKSSGYMLAWLRHKITFFMSLSEWVFKWQFISREIYWLTLIEKIKESQHNDSQFLNIIKEVKEIAKPDFKVDEQGTLRLSKWVCAPYNEELKRESFHSTAYTMHPGSTKM